MGKLFIFFYRKQNIASESENKATHGRGDMVWTAAASSAAAGACVWVWGSS